MPMLRNPERAPVWWRMGRKKHSGPFPLVLEGKPGKEPGRFVRAWL